MSKYNKLLLLSCLFLIATSCIQDLKKKSNSATNSGAGLNESVTVSYSSLALTESLTNTGQFTQTINLSLNAGSFASNLAPHYNLANLPIGLTSSLVKVSSRTAILTILGQATTHESVNSTNLQFSLSDSAVSGFLQASAADVQGKNQVFSLNFINPAKLLYSATSFLENTDNLGLVTQTRTITLTGDTFSFNLAGDYFFSNVPAGLTGNLERLTDTQILLSFTGNALAHGTNDSIVNISLTFLNTAFNYNSQASNVIGFQTPNIAINFYTSANLAYSRDLFHESLANDGSVVETSIISLSGDLFALDLTGTYTITNVPIGLTASIQRLNDIEAMLVLTGNTATHTIAQTITNLTVQFLDTAFQNIALASNVTNYIKSDIAINYFSNPVISYDNSVYFEDLINLGSITGKTTISLQNDKFVTDLSNKYTLENLPPGLIPNLVRINDSTLELSFTGYSSSHLISDSVGNLSLIFLDSAFEYSAATLVSGYQKTDFFINFFSYPTIFYSTDTFNEVVANDGSTIDSCIINLINEKFNADISSSFTITGYPAGLIPTLLRISDTQAALSFSGNATNHDGADTVSNIQFSFDISAFVYSNNISYVQNSTQSNFQVIFNNMTSLTYAQSIFNENLANDGSVIETTTITLTNDTFETSLAGQYVISNVPAGLTPVLTRNSSTMATLSFSGNAVFHAAGNSITNISLIFADGAFVNSVQAANVINYTKADLRIVFQNAASLAYSQLTFNENATNLGAIDETATITLTGDLFNANIIGNYTFSNVPVGLTGTLIRDSSTQLTMSFSGNATNHYPINNISNIQLTFSDAIFVTTPLAVDVTNSQVSYIAMNFFNPSFINDPLVNYAWHLKNTGQSNFSLTPGFVNQDINIPLQTMDLSGVTGDGIAVAVSDTGVEIAHEDLAANNDGANNRNYNNGQANWIADPTPVDPHGTMVTGLIAAVAENNLGSRGIAPEVDFSGFTFVGINAPNLASDLDQLTGPFDIFNYSYGFEQCQGVVLDPSFIAQIKIGVENLRLGNGANYVKSAGNSFLADLQQTCPGVYAGAGIVGLYVYAGNSNLANDMAYPYELVVGAVNAKGIKSSYSSPGSNIWISAMGGEFGQTDPAMMTTDQSTCAVGVSAQQGTNPVNNFETGLNTALNPTCKYTSVMNGTSSAAPVTSGVIALILEANNNLGYRDVRKILADTARKVDATSVNLSNPIGIAVPPGHIYEPGWIINAAGYNFHNWYGFGVINAKDAVTAAQNTVSYLGPVAEANYASGTVNVAIPDNSATGGSHTIISASTLTIESIQIIPNITHNFMSEVGIELTSPSGSKSVLLNLNSNIAQSNWNAELLTNAFYGETATGNWTIKVLDGVTADTGVLSNWSIKIYGH